MAVTHVADHTGGTSTTSGLQVTATLASNVAAGNMLVITVAADNLSSTTPTVTLISTPIGETATWSQLAAHTSDSATAAAACVGEMWGIVTTQQWNSAATITVTLSGSVVAKCTTLTEFAGCTVTKRGTAGSGTSSAGTPTATTAGTTPVTGDLVLGVGSCEQNVAMTGDSDTLNGSWSTALTKATTGGGSAANMSTLLQYKIITAGGNQTFNPTGASDSGCAVVAMVPTVVQPSGDASQAETVTLASTGTVGTFGDATQAETVTLTASGSRNLATTAVALAATVTLAAVGAVSFAGTASQTATVTLTASGTVGASTGASQAQTVTLTASGSRNLTTGATLATTVSATSTGTVGASTGGFLTSTVTLTAAGSVTGAGIAGDASSTVTTTLAAAGSVGVSATSTQPITVTLTAAGTAVGAVVPGRSTASVHAAVAAAASTKHDAPAVSVAAVTSTTTSTGGVQHG